MVWGNISITGETGLATTEGHLNVMMYQQPVAVPYLHNLGSNPILQDDNAQPHRVRVITDYL